MNEETTATLDAIDGLEAMQGLEGYEGTNAIGAIDPSAAQAIEMILLVSNFASLAFYLLSSWGIYMLAKKMKLKRAWMSWLPILQYYPLAQAGSKSVLSNFVYPFLSIIGASFLAGILGFFGTIGGIIGGIAIIASMIYTLIKVVQVYSGISKNTGRGGWTTAGLFFIGFIMLPVVGYKYKGGELKSDENVAEKKEETKEEL